MTVDRLLVLLSSFFAEASSTSFCSNNPDALGIDESVKGTLKSIAHLPPSPLRDDRMANSAAGTTENLVPEEAGKNSSVVGTGK